MKKTTVVINLFGSSGTGKSTLAASLFAELKLKRHNVELVREYVKMLVWDERKIKSPEEQVYIFAKQAKEERILYGKVEFIVTDSPLWLPAFYENHFHKNDKNHTCIMSSFTQGYLNNVEKKGDIVNLNFWLDQLDTYEEEGRWQTKEEATQLHHEMKRFLVNNNVSLITLPQDHDLRVSMVLKELSQYK